jgi:hypothetical protein
VRNKALQILTGGLALTMLVVPAAQAGRRKPQVKTTRTVSYQYNAPAGAAGPAGTAQMCVDNNGCYSFGPERGEKYLTLEITDATGTPAPFLVSTGDGTSAATRVYCGKTDAPVWLNAGPVQVTVGAASPPDCAGAGTTGTISGVFSNLP